jgi:predicted Zn-dependent protease
MLLSAGAQTSEDPAQSDAMAAFKQGHYAEARTLLAPVMAKTPEDPRLLLLLGRLSLAEKKPKEALPFFIQAHSKKDCPGTVDLFQGDALLLCGETGKAEASYRSFLDQDPKSPTAQLRLVYAKLKQNDYAAALEWANNLDPLDTFNPAYFFAQAALAEARSKSDEAKAAIERARTNYGNAIFASSYGDYLFLTK